LIKVFAGSTCCSADKRFLATIWWDMDGMDAWVHMGTLWKVTGKKGKMSFDVKK